MSSAAKMAETTAAPSAPVPASAGTVRSFRPPMATTGMSTAAQMAARPSAPTSAASGFVGVPNTAPTPR